MAQGEAHPAENFAKLLFMSLETSGDHYKLAPGRRVAPSGSEAPGNLSRGAGGETGRLEAGNGRTY